MGKGSNKMALSKSLGTAAAVATIISVSGSAVFMLMKIQLDSVRAQLERVESEKQDLADTANELRRRLRIQQNSDNGEHEESYIGGEGQTSRPALDLKKPSDFTIRLYHSRTSPGGRSNLLDLKARLRDKGFQAVEIIFWKKGSGRGNKYFGNDLAIDVVPKKRKRVYYPSEAQPVLDVLKELIPSGNRRYIERGKSTKQHDIEGSKLDRYIDVIIPP